MRTRITHPNLKFVPARESQAEKVYQRYYQKPMKISRGEALEAASNREIYHNAAAIAAAAVRSGLLKMPTKRKDMV
jgi:hypothetical protein